MTTIKWAATILEADLIHKIANRALELAEKAGVAGYEKQTLMMDLEACHCNGCPLELEKLLAARDGDFGHDVFGIARKMNRETGELTDCFLPRYAVKPRLAP